MADGEEVFYGFLASTAVYLSGRNAQGIRRDVECNGLLGCDMWGFF